MEIALFTKYFSILCAFLALCIASFTWAFHPCLQDQKILLLELKEELRFNSSILNWNHTPVQCCSWVGVECDGDGHVISLLLDGKSISGKINGSSILFSFRHLEYLNLAHNDFGGSTILSAISNITHLRSLDLGNTMLSGSLPYSIGNLTMLSYLDLSNCALTGVIPLALANLKELTHLDLSNNSFSGSIPSFYTLKELSYVDLSQNKLTGSFPSVNTKAISMVHLDLSFNSLGGCIPSSLFAVPSVEVIQLSHNHFNGLISEFSTLQSSNIVTIDLSRNRLGGRIPESIFKLSKLEDLSLSHNSFNGTPKFGKLQSPVFSLDISYNNLSIDATDVDLNWYGFSQLQTLKLASCNLYKFPHLRNHSSLRFLDLSNNKITGDIPSWLWEMANRSTLGFNLSLNYLVDFEKPYHIPDDLLLLDLQSNLFEGQMPSTNAMYMDFSRNKFNSLPVVDITNFTSYGMRFIIFTSNSLSGSILTSFCNASVLSLLDLSHNKLSGSIPPCLLKDYGGQLEVLNLEGNNIQGSIPDEFPESCGLLTLNLRKNNFSGNIPQSLSHCTYLEIFSVAHNKIEDYFPCMIPSSLRVIVLRSNKFHGAITCGKSWENLQIMDIASNNFSGNLYQINFSSIWRGMLRDSDAPKFSLSEFTDMFPEIGKHETHYQDTVGLTFKTQEYEFANNLRILTAIDLSCNNFQGEIPIALGDLKSLHILNLSHNVLTGQIPKSFKNLIQLESLDLSMNQLTGEIPKDLAGLTFLSALNLSYNELVGEIPQDNQFETFPVSSFEGNMGLCGFPLDRKCNKTGENGASGVGDQLYKMDKMDWEYLSDALGFGMGFGGIVWVLFGSKCIEPIFSEKAEQLFQYTFVKQQNRRRGQRRRVLEMNQVRRS